MCSPVHVCRSEFTDGSRAYEVSVTPKGAELRIPDPPVADGRRRFAVPWFVFTLDLLRPYAVPRQPSSRLIIADSTFLVNLVFLGIYTLCPFHFTRALNV